MARSLAALLFVPLAFMLMGARTVLVDPSPSRCHRHRRSKSPRPSRGIVRPRVVSKDENGQIDAVLNVRTHTARVAIPYNAKEVRIKYVSSDNLDYSEKNGERHIHGNYMKWVRNMQADIQRELQLLTIK
jgi:hypothetical protein